MPNSINRQWILARTPAGPVTHDIFEWRESAVAEPGSGEVLVRTRLLSIDPANRAWMKGRTYREQVMPGDVMHGFTIGEVVRSNSPRFQSGDIVEGMGGWQDYAVLPAETLTQRDAKQDPIHLMGVLGITGLTAYYGLLDVGRIRAGDTVLISAAAGAVGSVAGQIARIAGCRAVGVAGGAEKCAWLVEELGFDAAVDYKQDDLRRQLATACPDGVNVYFDNVGGEILDAALPAMKLGGRIVCCGAVSGYDSGEAPRGSPLLPGILIGRRLHMDGFIVLDHFATRAEAEARLIAWIEQGSVKVVVDLHEGLETAPQALIGLLAGANRGKVIVRAS